MKIYLVGGAVRNKLMGLEPKDYDYCVVGSTPEEMLSLGYKQVGQDFPVFLHPETGEEYALARTEYKEGRGYKGFKCTFGPDVTLEDDLKRRDLTINSIAQDLETGEYIDPFGGVSDVKNKVLRATSESYKDDPLRCLRLARFWATFGSEWSITPETHEMNNQLYYSGEFKHLTPERIWLETEKALKTSRPDLYFLMLNHFDIFPFLTKQESVKERKDYHPESNVFIHTMMVLRYAAQKWNDPVINFCCLTHDAGKSLSYDKFGMGKLHEQYGLDEIDKFCEHFHVPNTYKESAKIVCEFHGMIHKCRELKATTLYKLIDRTKALQDRTNFDRLLKSCEADAKGRGEPICFEDYTQPKYLNDLLDFLLKINKKQVVQEAIAKGKQGAQIGEYVRMTYVNEIKKFKKENLK